jgi:hypothetical protein
MYLCPSCAMNANGIGEETGKAILANEIARYSVSPTFQTQLSLMLCKLPQTPGNHFFVRHVS